MSEGVSIEFESLLRQIFPDRPDMVMRKIGWIGSILVHISADAGQENTLWEIFREIPPDLRPELLRRLSMAETRTGFHVDQWAFLVWDDDRIRESLMTILRDRPDYRRIRKTGTVEVGGIRVFVNPTPLKLLHHAIRAERAHLYLASSRKHGAVAQAILDQNRNFMFPKSMFDQMVSSFPGSVRTCAHQAIWKHGEGCPPVPDAEEMLSVLRRIVGDGDPQHRESGSMRAGHRMSGTHGRRKTADDIRAFRICRAQAGAIYGSILTGCLRGTTPARPNE